MAGDYSKNGFVPARRASAVLMQQGRVTLDSDQNEQATVVDRRIPQPRPRYLGSGLGAGADHARRL